MPAMNAGYTLGGRQARRRHPGARQPRPRDRPREAGRHPPAARPEHQERRRRWTSPSSGRPTRTSCAAPRNSKLTVADFQGTTISLTNPGTIGTVHSVPRLMAGPGHDRRRRRDGLPGRVRRHVRGAPQPDGHLQGAHPDVDLRPPDHPGRAVRRLPADRREQAARPGRLLRPDLRGPAGPVRAGPLGPRPVRPGRRPGQARPDRRAHPLLPVARPPHGRHRPAGLPPAPAPGPGRPERTASRCGTWTAPSRPAASAARTG